MTRIMGIDVGIASIGFGLIDFEEKRIITCGAHLFDKAEDPKTGASLATPRRKARSQRRRLRRWRQRRQGIIKIMNNNGLDTIEILHSALRQSTPPQTPWQLRAEGLSRRLEPDEFSQVLLHIAKRRGFQSTRKTQTSDDDESKVMLEAARELRERMTAGGFETIGSFLASLAKKRNPPGAYTHTVLRDLIRDEVFVLFERQRALGNPMATSELQKAYSELCFFQLPLPPSIDLVGYCSLEEGEKRAPKAARSAELFVAYSRLSNLRILNRHMQSRDLTLEQKNLLLENAHRLKSGVTFTKVRSLLKLNEEEIFNLAKYRRDKPGQETWADVRKKAENEPLVRFQSWFRLQDAISGVDKMLWRRVRDDAAFLDQIAATLAFYEDEADVRPRLETLGLDDACIKALMPIHFKQTINLSLKALNNIIPFMKQGHPYDIACRHAGYHHSHKENQRMDKLPPFEPTRNPVVDRSLAQTRKVINALIQRYGIPDYFHIEMGRELGKSFRVRREIEREQAKFQKHKKEMAGQAKEIFGREPSGTEFLKYRLWKEQGGYCLYSGKYIEPGVLRDPIATQVDHALPRSRSWDNSYSNQVLCLIAENQNKGNQTPYEYLKGEAWDAFVARVKSLSVAKQKKMLIQNFDEDVAKDWKERNLTDTRYVARVLKNHIERNLRRNPGVNQMAQARNGFITTMLRNRWGLGRKARDESVRHHALDAIILACTTNGMVKEVAGWSRSDRQKELRDMPKPWTTFRNDALEAVSHVFVSRQPERKATGAAHKDTIKSQRVDPDTGEKTIVKKVNLKKLTPDLLARLVDVEIEDGQPTGRNKSLYTLLKQRLDEHNGEAGKAFETPIHMPTNKDGKGPVIRSVKIRTNDKTGVYLPGRNGVADNDSIIRTDVFLRQGKYYLIPVYVNHLAVGVMPMRVCKAYKDENLWPKIDNSYHFLFSLYKNDYVVVEKKNMEVLEGYFIKMNRSTAAITIRPHDASDHKRDISSIGVLSLKKLRKFTVSHLGDRYEVKQEKRLGLENRTITKPDEAES